jgi:hypothetical protein
VRPGDTWLTRSNAGSFNAFNSSCIEADILINKYNNAKGGGLVALLQTDPGDKGLFLLLIDSGNTDRLTLNTIDPKQRQDRSARHGAARLRHRRERVVPAEPGGGRQGICRQPERGRVGGEPQRTPRTRTAPWTA